ncbi:uncharacterized protein LOC103712550 [Phoenix dactylifera]|uniref:Uncharacterized protein LOC103712550 n=1 Tax=Phoenix dactylifera TaxID=42345 RepID=A0A8B8J7F1_PHODC|nr:uncharacterized protein LOC103712550 [Phoenix dactylifera]
MVSSGPVESGKTEAVGQGDKPARPQPKAARTGRTWAEVAKGTARPPIWTNHQISEVELEALKQRFMDVVEIPSEEGELARAAWRDTMVIVRSAGCRVPVEWICRVRVVGKLDYDVEEFLMSNETFAFRFRTGSDREAAMEAGPWLVASQLLAMERWRPNFVPDDRQLSRLVVWLKLPNLSMEYWTKGLIWNIAVKAGRPLALDKITDLGRMLGFARVKVELDARAPIRSGTFIRGVELELRKLEAAVEAIHENLLYLKAREAEMREVSERTNARVAWFGIMSLDVCIVVPALQLWHLKRFFQKKKLIKIST